MLMLSIGEFISIISLCVTCFSVGYAIGNKKSGDS